MGFTLLFNFGTKPYRQVVGIPMGTNCAPLVADLFLFFYERDIMMSLPDDNDIVSTEIYDKRDDFDFEIVNFPFFRW